MLSGVTSGQGGNVKDFDRPHPCSTSHLPAISFCYSCCKSVSSSLLMRVTTISSWSLRRRGACKRSDNLEKRFLERVTCEDVVQYSNGYVCKNTAANDSWATKPFMHGLGVKTVLPSTKKKCQKLSWKPTILSFWKNG